MRRNNPDIFESIYQAAMSQYDPFENGEQREEGLMSATYVSRKPPRKSQFYNG